MRIGLIGRCLDSFDTEASLRVLAQELTALGHECLLFITDKHLEPGERATRFASFYVSAGGKLVPVQVQKAGQGSFLLFAVSSEDAVIFAAAVAVILQKLAANTIKPDIMHLFSARDLCTALACRQYFQLPFVYSVRRIEELKQKKDDFLCLGLKLPARGFPAGEYLYVEQLAAETARYVVDETATAPLWPAFFSAFAGRCVAGKPFVHTGFWTREKEKARPAYKKEILGKDAAAEMAVIVSPQKPLVPPAAANGGAIFLPEASTLAERQKQYRAADFFWLTKETAGQQVVAAMAAGCLPIVPEKSPLSSLWGSEERIREACYFYMEATLEATLRAALATFREKPEALWAKRRQLVQAIRELYSLQAAAVLYDKIYRGFAPAHLPFLLEDEKIPAVTGR